ncbi:hypothetical protein [Pedobacter sandarakinus]|uniref:hypothetical protein n=1 Tax=Pedobacter sandarakinus TaxID=353156 RepID=UPI002245CA16|nr:hypothetical protein [Pedobacter sandarakinus]MCX2573126.1 hypothetical protein [Pedobacter sandarakinus]
MEINKLIESGLMETYVMGIATEDEVEQVLMLKKQHPEFAHQLAKLEYDMEVMAHSMAIEPPPGILAKIENEINEIRLREQHIEEFIQKDYTTHNDYKKQERFIEVESESNQMRIHKSWRLVFAAVFILGKIFLGFALYFYLENRQAQEQIKDLKIELKHNKFPR